MPLGQSLNPNSPFSACCCLLTIAVSSTPAQDPTLTAGLGLGSTGVGRVSRAHFQVDIPSARSPTVRLAKNKVWDLIWNLLAWMLPSPSLPLPRTSVSSTAPCAIYKSAIGIKAAGRRKLVPPLAFFTSQIISLKSQLSQCLHPLLGCCEGICTQNLICD